MNKTKTRKLARNAESFPSAYAQMIFTAVQFAQFLRFILLIWALLPYSVGHSTKIFPLILSKWIMCTIGGLGRYSGRYIDRYIGRLSTDYRPLVGRQSVD